MNDGGMVAVDGPSDEDGPVQRGLPLGVAVGAGTPLTSSKHLRIVNVIKNTYLGIVIITNS